MSIKTFDEKYGKMGITQKLSDINDRSIILSSGLFGFDVAHGIGGVKTGGIIRIMGPAGVGKSSISYRLAANGLKAGMSVLVIDLEGKLNLPIYMDTLEDAGINPDDPELHQRFITAVGNDSKWVKGNIPTIERIIPLISDWLEDPLISPNGAIIIIDSVDVIASDTMVDSKVDDATVALVPRRLKNWLRLFNFKVVQSKSLLVFIHQVSANIGPMVRDKEMFTGGNSINHLSKMNLRLKDIGQETEGGEIVGRKVRGVITKSAQGISWRSFEYVIRYDVGPDNYTSILEAAKKLKIIGAKGSWLEVPGMEQLIQGKESLRQHWIDNPSDFRYIENLVMEHLRVSGVDTVVSTEPEEIEEEDSE